MVEQQSLVDVIVADHREVEATFKELEQDDEAPEHRRVLVEHVITELGRHSIAEEMYMYPAARRLLPDGDRIADHEIAEHGDAEQVMRDLEKAKATDPEFATLVARLIADVRHHIEEEESELLPRLEEACSAEDLQELGRKVVEAKDMAHTRPWAS